MKKLIKSCLSFLKKEKKDLTISTSPSKSEGNWFFYKNANLEFYTHTSRLKKQNFILGKRDKAPNPGEVFDFLKKYPEAELAYGMIGILNDADDTEKKPVLLPNGVYTHERATHYSDLPERLVPTEIRNDRTVFLPNNYQSIVEDIKAFLSAESYAIDKELGIQHRLGILLYGPPGTGKTTLIRSIIKDVVPQDSVVIFMEHLFSRDMNKKLRDYEDGRLKVLVYEELASTVENVKIDRLLDFLDGEKSLNNTLVLATTNYPEKLPANIVDRPGRFDRLYKIGDPNKETRKILLEFYLSRSPTEKEISMSEGMSAAAIKELCLIMRRRKREMPEVIEQMKKHSELVKKEFKEARAIGFHSSRDIYDVFDDD